MQKFEKFTKWTGQLSVVEPNDYLYTLQWFSAKLFAGKRAIYSISFQEKEIYVLIRAAQTK